VKHLVTLHLEVVMQDTVTGALDDEDARDMVAADVTTVIREELEAYGLQSVRVDFEQTEVDEV